MRKLLTFIFLIHQMLPCAAQEVENTYVKYRFQKKNSSSIIGQIVEKTAEGPYKVLLDNGTTIEIKEQEIFRITPLKSRGSSRSQQIARIQEYKWGYTTEIMGVSNGFRNIGTPGISTGVAVAAHRYLTSSISVGGGVGMYNYDLDARRLLIPLFAEGKWRLVKQSSTPIISAKLGHGLAAKNYLSGLQDKKGGLFFNPFFGYEFGTDRKIGWTMGIGVLLQKAYYNYTNGSTFVDEDIIFRRTEFKLAISIH